MKILLKNRINIPSSPLMESTLLITTTALSYLNRLITLQACILLTKMEATGHWYWRDNTKILRGRQTDNGLFSHRTEEYKNVGLMVPTLLHFPDWKVNILRLKMRCVFRTGRAMVDTFCLTGLPIKRVKAIYIQ